MNRKRTIGSKLEFATQIDFLTQANVDTYPYAPAPISQTFNTIPDNATTAVPQTVEPIVEIRPPNDISNNVLTIQGGIFNSKSEPINNAMVYWYDLKAAQKTEDLPVPLNNTNGYFVTPPSDYSNIGLWFEAKGYTSVVVPIDILLTSPDVTMTKETSIMPWMISAVMIAVAMHRKKSGKVGALKQEDIKTVYLILGGIIGLAVIYKILNKFGLINDPAISNEQTDPDSPWKPNYWLQFNKFTFTFTGEQALDMADTIYNAFSVTNDNYSQVLSVISKCRTKANVSFIAWEFQKQYGMDMFSFLQDGGGLLPWDGLSSDHMKELIDLVNKLPSN